MSDLDDLSTEVRDERMGRGRLLARRSLLAAAALAALAALAAGLLIAAPGWISARRAADYREAAARYAEYAAGYDSGDDFSTRGFSSCYGERWDGYSMDVVEPDIRAHAGDRAYRRARAEHFRRLAGKYRAAAEEPGRPVALDPPLSP